MKLHLLLPAILLCATLITPWPTSAAASEQEKSSHIKLAVVADVLADYKVFTYGRKPADITDYSGPMSRRDVIEVVLFQQALLLGGMDVQVDFVPEPTYLRMSEDLRGGHVDAVGSSMWLCDLDKFKDKVFVSLPVIRDGEFEAGLYTSPDNALALNARTFKQVRTLTAASNRNWIPDWNTLEAMQVKDLHHVQSWPTMVRMVSRMRADFLLAPFQASRDMLLHVDDMTLMPIPGIKVGLHGTRHFGISASRPMSREIFEAIQRGLTVLRERGALEKAYRQSGFFNKRTANWPRINPD